MGDGATPVMGSRTTTPFLGRSEELAEVRARLGARRLVALVGVAGVGKTRLALEVARGLEERFADGVAFVDLAPLVGSEPLVRTVAMATRSFDAAADSSGEEALAARMMALLADRETFIVLDNCEHIIDASAHLVTRLLDACPDLKILATSRQSLSVVGESVLRVGSMGHAAEELFVARALAAGAAVDPNRDGALIAAICERLDGIALAVELAAARAALMPLADIDARLDDALGLLAAPERDRSDRHSRFEAALEWSYGLLEPDEQRLFRRLGVFQGGWTLASAEAVCGGGGLPVVRALSGLVDKSLVTYDPHQQRYRFLEPIRQFAWSALVASGEAAELIEVHLAALRAMAVEINSRILHSGVRDADQAEFANFRTAIERALDRDDDRGALRLFVSLGWYWVLTGSWREGTDFGRRALTGGRIGPRLSLLGHSMVAGYLAYSGRPAEAGPHVEAARELLDASPDDYGARYLLSTALECRGESPADVLVHGESRARAAGDHAFAAYLAATLGRWHILMWQLDAAVEPLQRAARHLKSVPDAWFAVTIRMHQAALDVLRGEADPEDTVRLIDYDHRRSELTSFSAAEQSILMAVAGDPSRAAPFIGRAARRAAYDGWMQRVVVNLALAGVVRARLGQADLALTLHAAAEATLDQTGYAPLPIISRLGAQDLDAAARSLGPTATDLARRRGERLDAAAAVELAASPIPTPGAGPLSSRETEIVAMVGAGLDNAAIAAELFISRRTVDAHLSHIRDKLGISGRVGLARWAIDRHLTTAAREAAG